MLRIINIEELQSFLTRIPGLILLYENKESNFFSSVKEWLGQVEKILENNRMPNCSDIALLKGNLIAVERGMIPDGIAFTNRKSHKKAMDAAAVEALKMANEMINGIIKGPLTQINEAERLIRQIAPIAERKGLFNHPELRHDHSTCLQESWKGLLDDPELAGICLHIKGLVSAQDILMLLDRIIPGN